MSVQARVAEWPKAAGLRPAPEGVRGFKSLPSHHTVTYSRLRMDPATTATRALAGHDGLRETEDGYCYDQTSFAAVATVESATLAVTVRMPALAAVVEGSVGDAVAAGWYETLCRRLEDVDQALSVGSAAITPRTRSTPETVTVTYEIDLQTPERAGDDVVAVAQFVEGTYLQGVVPGYAYTDPVRSMLQQASAAAGSDDIDPGRGGTPL